MIPTTPGFGLDHLPYGSIRLPSGRRSLAVRVGDHVLDLRSIARAGLAPMECDASNMDRLLASRPDRWRLVRETIAELVTDRYASRIEAFTHRLDAVETVLPFTVGDFVDFYSSEAHATTVGRIFRPDGEPLPSNWKHLPIGYHGRAGTVQVSGTPVARPSGVVDTDAGPRTMPTRRLDYEVEMGWVVGGTGEQPTIADARSRIFGFLTVNDWSARDIQAFESAPLGPFLGKSFQTSVGGWVTPLSALEAHVVAPPQQDPTPPDHLVDPDPWCVDVVLTVSIVPAGSSQSHEVGHMRYRDLHWTPAQQFAHMTVNGASARPGDLCASGTISGWDSGEEGCLLERQGSGPVQVGDDTREWLADGDEVIIEAATPDGEIHLAEVRGRVTGGT